MLKTHCTLVLVLLGMVVAGTAQSENPDPNPTTCYAPANQRRCDSMEAFLDAGFKRGVDSFATKGNVATIEECFQLCMHIVEGCKAINYKKSTRECEFVNDLGQSRTKNAGPKDTRYEFAPEYDSAVVKPDHEDFCNSANQITEHHRGGSDYVWRGPAVNSMDCAKQCVNDPKCVAFDFNYANSSDLWCFLKHRTIPDITDISSTMTGLPCPIAKVIEGPCS